MAKKRGLTVLLIAVVMFFMAFVWMNNSVFIAKLGLPAVIVLVLIFREVINSLEKEGKYLKKRARDAERGARGEIKVSEKLKDLPDGYNVLHDIAFQGFNVDHIVIGPTGIFVIETKSHHGKVTAKGDIVLLNGHMPEKDFINQTWKQVYSIKELLKERSGKEWSLKPVLCFTNAFVEVRGAVKGIAVVNIKFLTQYLTGQAPRLPDSEIGKVTDLFQRGQ